MVVYLIAAKCNACQRAIRSICESDAKRLKE